MRIHTCTRVPCVLLLAFGAVLPGWSAHAEANFADCGFELTDALDGDFTNSGNWVEYDTLDNLWTAVGVYVSTGPAHSGSYMAAFDTPVDQLWLDGYGDTHGVGTVTFYYRATSSGDSMGMKLFVEGDPIPVWEESSGWSTTYQMATVVVNRPGDVVLRWFRDVLFPNSGTFFLDDVVVTTYDSTPPNAAVTAITPSPTNSDTVSFSVEFDEYVRNFDALGDLDIVAGGTLAYTGVDINGGPESYTVDVNGITGDGDLTLGVELLSDVQDVAENALGSSTTDTVTIDNTGPTTTIELVSYNPTQHDQVDFLVTFSEPVWPTFWLEDLGPLTGTLGPSSFAAMTGADPAYTVTAFFMDSDEDGTIGITITAGSVMDALGNPYGGDSSALYSIYNFHGFLAEPEDTRLYIGDSHVFPAQADCLSPTLHYQWKWDDGAKAVHDVGDDSPALAIYDAALADRGDYWCAVSYNDEAYYSNTGTLGVEPHLEIVLEPEGGEKYTGDAHTFTVVTTGGYQPLAYAWKKNAVAIPDATSGIYTIDPLDVDDTGAYTVEIADDYTDAVESAPAVLTVTVQVPAAGLAGLIALAAACAVGGATVIRRRR